MLRVQTSPVCIVLFSFGEACFHHKLARFASFILAHLPIYNKFPYYALITYEHICVVLELKQLNYL